LVLALAFAAPLAINAADTGKTFATPEAAVSALVAAASAKDTNALHDIFGPAGADIANPDRVQAANELKRSPPHSTRPTGSCASRIPSACWKWVKNPGRSRFRL
jgi:anti-sigma factor ChrR (cupin superfamily)